MTANKQSAHGLYSRLNCHEILPTAIKPDPVKTGKLLNSIHLTLCILKESKPNPHILRTNGIW